MAKAGIDLEKAWFVVRTNIRCEEKAANNLRLARFDVYWPRYRYEIKHRRTNQYTTHERSLMPRYMFVGMDKKAKHFGFVRSCEGVERFLEVQGEPISLKPKEVQAIYLAEVDMKFDDTREARKYRGEALDDEFPKGMSVFIRDLQHAFAGFEGEVVSTDHKKRLQLALGAFGKIWIDADSCRMPQAA